MANPMTRENIFEPEVVYDLFNKVQGKSSLAILSNQEPIPFNGTKSFVFDFDNEIEVVGEGQPKSAGGVTIEPVIMTPIKVQYSARFTDEFTYASAEKRMGYLKAFNDGYAKKLARGLDLMAFHGLNPYADAKSDTIGTNNFNDKVTQQVTYDASKIDENIEDAIALIEGSGANVNGMALAPEANQAMGRIENGMGVRMYPEFRFSATPDSFGGMRVDKNETVSAKGDNKAYIGDFANSFKWGFAKQIPLEVIEYGDPDGLGRDLKRYNEVLLRSETYIGWGILRPEAFARIEATA